MVPESLLHDIINPTKVRHQSDHESAHRHHVLNEQALHQFDLIRARHENYATLPRKLTKVIFGAHIFCQTIPRVQEVVDQKIVMVGKIVVSLVACNEEGISKLTMLKTPKRI